MLRKSAWRHTASDAVSAHQDQALSTTIFLLKSYGPTGFLLKEDGEARNFKVNEDAYRPKAAGLSVSMLQYVLLSFIFAGVLG